MRRTVLAVTIAVLAVLSVGGSALAQTGPASAPTLSATASTETVRSYLRSIGVDPVGVVVQRGDRNFAGEGCPGAGWSCTSATNVVQITNDGVNVSRCSATGGPATISRSGSGGNVACTIVQSSTSGANVATCEQISVTGVSGSALQECRVTQTSTTGANTATVEQTLVQGPLCLPFPLSSSPDQTQGGRQFASISQSSPSGAGVAKVEQGLWQCAARLTTSAVSQSQTTSQEFQILQAPPGFDPESPACTGASGTLLASAAQEQRQIGYAPKAASGTQTQLSDLIGQVDQCSTGRADYTVEQTEDQRAIAPATVAQTQTGPVRCCSFQGVNPADTCTVTQVGKQSGNVNAVQTESISALAGTSGSCSSAASVIQNGVTNTSSASGSVIVNDGLLNCVNGVCQIETEATYTGPTTGDYTDTVTLSGKLTEEISGLPLAGKPVTLGLGTQACSATTGAAGDASCSITITQAPSVVSASIEFDGDADYNPSSASVSFTITTEEVSLTYAGPTYRQEGQDDHRLREASPRRHRARRRDADVHARQRVRRSARARA